MKRIRRYSGATDETKVSAYWQDGKIKHLTSQNTISALRDAVSAIGEESLGFKASQVDCHSIRLGADMVMYLGECPIYTIMLIGRWSSDAFLRCTRKQVEQFSHNVSNTRIHVMSYRHIPVLELRTSHLDPRQRNHPDNA